MTFVAIAGMESFAGWKETCTVVENSMVGLLQALALVGEVDLA